MTKEEGAYYDTALVEAFCCPETGKIGDLEGVCSNRPDRKRPRTSVTKRSLSTSASAAVCRPYTIFRGSPGVPRLPSAPGQSLVSSHVSRSATWRGNIYPACFRL